MILSEQKKRHLKVFGFTRIDGFVSDGLGELRVEFEKLLESWSGGKLNNGRSCVPDVARKHSFFDSFLSFSGLAEIAKECLGEKCVCLGGDASVFGGDTSWHLDSWQNIEILKFAVYLDEHTHGKGSFRAIPGSHRPVVNWRELLGRLEDSEEVFGLREEDIPSWNIDIHPGDLIIFDLRLVHSVWGGQPRRQLAYRFAAAASNDIERSEIARYILAEKNLA